MSSLTITVLIPTFKRVTDLTRCLEAIKRQERLPEKVAVTVRDIDTETINFLAQYDSAPLTIVSVLVEEPGVVAAMNAGLMVIESDITVLTDDDTAAYPDWLLRIEKHFAIDPKVGGVGGRDHQAIHPGAQPVVGIVQYTGRIVGNHHLGVGPSRRVDVLKGANCAYRTVPLKQIGFDRRLMGSGAQVNWELGIGLTLQRAGWVLIYDPEIQVDHFMAVRYTEDQYHRGGAFNPNTHTHAVHNETIFLWEHFSLLRKVVFVSWFLLLGTRTQPGIVQLIRIMLTRQFWFLSHFRPTLKGRWQGIRHAYKG